MKKLIISGVLSFVVVALAWDSEAFERRRGLELEGRLGSNTCIDNGDFECDGNHGYTSGFGGGGFLGLRPLSFLAIGLDAAGYTLTPRAEGISKAHTTQAMLGLRFYIPFNFIEPFVKFGVGYLSRVDEDGDAKLRAYSWGNFKFGLGATLYVIDSDRVGNLGVGVDMDFSIHTPTKWKECDDDDNCESGDWPDADPSPVTMQLNLHFKWIIPIL